MVSVCIATFNGEKYIKQQLDSILYQLDINDEVIISDDNSTDKTIEIISRYKDSRIKILNANFRDFRKNFENALKVAKGEYIFLSDQDDVWLSGKYKRCLEIIQEYDLVVTDSILVDDNLQEIKPSFFKFYNSGKGILKNIYRSTYFGSCMAFKKRLLTYSLPLPKTKEIGHDLWIGIVAEIIGNVFFLNEPLLLYRRHEYSFVNLTLKMNNRKQRNIFIKIFGRFIMLKEILFFYLKYRFIQCKNIII
jgi:glycosyltransferase involved in cell wall biosynthesis